MDGDKQAIYEFWNEASCGERVGLAGLTREDYLRHSAWRYNVEPMIPEFAHFDDYRGRKVLEIGVGLGSDHQQFAKGGAELWGVDLTGRAIEHTRRRFELLGLQSNLQQADAHKLPFPDGFFDLVYSWGVLHVSPGIEKALAEVHRVLKPGGEARVMIYKKHCFVGYMLWARYALLKMKPWMTLDDVYDRYLESPGMKCFTVQEAKDLFRAFDRVDTKVYLSPGDLLDSHVGQRHQGRVLETAKKIWPRRIIARAFPEQGLFLTLHAVK